MVNKVYFIEKLSIIISLSILFFSIFYIKNGNACSTAYLNFGCNGYKSCGPVFSSGWWFLGVCIGGDGSWVCDSVSGYDCTWSLCGPAPCSICSGKQWVYDWAYTSACPTGTGTNGQVCEIRGGNCCDTATSGTWDKSEGKCISCSGKTENIMYGDPSGIYGTSGTAGDKECESACGASSNCDEVDVGYPSLIGSGPYTEVLCDDNPECQEYMCDSSHACTKATTSIGAYTCYPAAGISGLNFFWLISGGAEGGIYGSYDECKDGWDNDCDGYTDCADPNCAGRAGPGGVTCCQSVSNCPACSNNVNPTCVSNTCHCDACTTTSQCISGYCCEFEKGGSQTCRYLGYIYGNVYLCDP